VLAAHGQTNRINQSSQAVRPRIGRAACGRFLAGLLSLLFQTAANTRLNTQSRNSLSGNNLSPAGDCRNVAGVGRRL